MLKITGHPNGRILMAGKDGSLYELGYSVAYGFMYHVRVGIFPPLCDRVILHDLLHDTCALAFFVPMQTLVVCTHIASPCVFVACKYFHESDAECSTLDPTYSPVNVVIVYHSKATGLVSIIVCATRVS